MSSPWFALALFLLSFFSGATATVVGFGIGSLLTPFLATRFGIATAVAAVMLPHAAATGVRCWRLRSSVDLRVLGRFGVLSAIGGLVGAFFYTRLGTPALTRMLGLLLLATAAAQLSGLASRWRPRGPVVQLLGLCSGLFGGIVGNQGGLRAAALTAFALPPQRFVATATAIGLAVDIARAPIYLWSAGDALAAIWAPIAVATAGVLVGTLVGERLLLGLPPARFGQLVACAIGILGVWFLLR